MRMAVLRSQFMPFVTRKLTTKSLLPPVPPNYSFRIPDSPELISQIKTIDEFHADTWLRRSEKTNCRETEHNRGTVKHFIECFWTYNSNALDGSSLSLEETMQHIALNEGLSGIAKERMTAAHNHDDAVKFLDREVSQNASLSPELIRELHFDLWRDTDTVTTGGKYRKGNKLEPLSNDEVRAFTEPKNIGFEVQELCDWVNGSTPTNTTTTTTTTTITTNRNHANSSTDTTNTTTHTTTLCTDTNGTNPTTLTLTTPPSQPTQPTQPTLHPIITASIALHNFHRIHPFDTGNGRVGRLVLNYVLTKYSYLPAVIRFRRRKEYAYALECANRGNIAPLVVFVVEEMSYTDYIYQFFTTEST